VEISKIFGNTIQIQINGVEKPILLIRQDTVQLDLVSEIEDLLEQVLVSMGMQTILSGNTIPLLISGLDVQMALVEEVVQLDLLLITKGI
jgi:hypothetical protein